MNASGFESEDDRRIKQQLEYWRTEYDNNVYSIEIGDITYIYRGITKGEYNRAVEWYDDEYERSEYICRECVLYPPIDWDSDIPAGVPEMLFGEMLKISGMLLNAQELDAEIARHEEQIQSLAEQMPLVIKAMFPEYTLDDIYEWQFERLMKYYVRAKWMLETIEGVKLEREEPIPGM